MESSRERSDAHEPGESGPPRRNLLAALLALVVGAIVSLAPLVPGLMVFLDPLRDENDDDDEDNGDEQDDRSGAWVPVTKLSALPADGVPRRFTLVTDREDAWTYYKQEPVGSIYLRRREAGAVPEAITTVCPHLGCSIGLKQEGQGESREHYYGCPCHESKFTLGGEVVEGPSPRALDELEVEVRNGDEVWVKYEKFHTGVAEKRVEA